MWGECESACCHGNKAALRSPLREMEPTWVWPCGGVAWHAERDYWSQWMSEKRGRQQQICAAGDTDLTSRSERSSELWECCIYSVWSSGAFCNSSIHSGMNCSGPSVKTCLDIKVTSIFFFLKKESEWYTVLMKLIHIYRSLLVAVFAQKSQ